MAAAIPGHLPRQLRLLQNRPEDKGMLSDDDRRRFDEFVHHLQDEEPELVPQLRDHRYRRHATGRWPIPRTRGRRGDEA